MKILTVDDNMTNLFALEKMLNLNKLYLSKACNGKECVERVKERGMDGFDLILMDINMPVMNGLEAAMEINNLVL